MKHVVIVGGGFAGVACARRLASHADVHITLIDKNNYQQFQPLLYQVATALSTGQDGITERRNAAAGLLLRGAFSKLAAEERRAATLPYATQYQSAMDIFGWTSAS